MPIRIKGSVTLLWVPGAFTLSSKHVGNIKASDMESMGFRSVQ